MVKALLVIFGVFFAILGVTILIGGWSEIIHWDGWPFFFGVIAGVYLLGWLIEGAVEIGIRRSRD